MTMTKLLELKTKERLGNHVAKGGNGDTFKASPGGVKCHM